jgi:PIN domain nuclease of toxin-antitoxin system
MARQSMIVLDTHVLLWTLQDDAKLGRQARMLLDDQAAADGILVSAITIWEIALLVRKDRLALRTETAKWVAEALDLPGLLLAPLDPAIAIDSIMLPGAFHNDPADRIIIATARYHDAPLLTVDRAILDYSAAGHVHTIDAGL